MLKGKMKQLNMVILKSIMVRKHHENAEYFNGKYFPEK